MQISKKPEDYSKPADCGYWRVSPALVPSEYATSITKIKGVKCVVSSLQTLHIHLIFPEHIVSNEYTTSVNWTLGMLLDRSCVMARVYCEIQKIQNPGTRINMHNMRITKINHHGIHMYVDVRADL
jgi:hypothetical protein